MLKSFLRGFLCSALLTGGIGAAAFAAASSAVQTHNAPGTFAESVLSDILALPAPLSPSLSPLAPLPAFRPLRRRRRRAK